MLFVQLLTVGFICGTSLATKPPGYIEKPKIHDPNPPNYDFGYSVSDGKGNNQGHGEHRDGEHTQGHYYIDLPKESSVQDVKYLADDWGFHPLVQYSSKSPHSSSSTTLALGEQAINRLAQDSNKPLSKGTTPISPLLVGTVLPAGTSTNAFIHHDNKNGIQTVHTMEPILATVQTIPQSAQPQYVQIQPQIGTLKIKPEPTVIISNNNNIVQHHTRPSGPQAYVDEKIIHEQRPISTAPGGVSSEFTEGNVYYEQPQTVSVPESLISDKLNAGITSYDDVSFTLQGDGGYGSKLSVDHSPINRGNHLIDNDNQRQVFSHTTKHFGISTTTEIPPISSTIGSTTADYSNAAVYSKLVSSTQNLVSNEDLLNINGAAEAEEGVDSSAVNENSHGNVGHYGGSQKQISNQHNIVHLQPSRNEYTVSSSYGRVTNPNFKRPAGAGIIAIEHVEGSDENKSFVNPIIVADFESEIKSTTQAPFTTVKSPFHDSNLYSTTQSTLETEVTSTHNYLTSHSFSENPTSTTVVVTPRPVSQKFLAPLNAGLRLVNSNKVDLLDFSTSDVKEVEDDVINQENIETGNGLKTVVELFRSQDLSPQTTGPQTTGPQSIVSQAQNLINQQFTNLQQNQHVDALESSKKIQDNLNQQLYQLGAQQVLIHPSDQKTQLAAEELSQQIEEHHEENVKQETHQQESQSSSHQESSQSLVQNAVNSNIQAGNQFTQQGINFGTGLNNIVQQGENFSKAFNNLQPQSIKFGNSLNNLAHENQLIENVGQVNSAVSQSHAAENHFEQHKNSNSESSTSQFSQEHNNEDNVQNSQENHNEYLVQTQQQNINENTHQHEGVSNAVYSPAISQSNEDEGGPMHVDLNTNIGNSQIGYESSEQGNSGQISSYTVTAEHPISTSSENHNNQVNVVEHQEYIGNNHQENGIVSENIVYKPIPVGVPIPVPQEIPYPVHHQHTVAVPVRVENRIPYPVEVQKFIDRPVPVPVEVEKRVPYPVHIETKVAIPYPVEKKVPYPVEVEKIVERPIEITKYIEKPYPVEVRVPHPVPIPYKVSEPYPVDRIVEKKIPYPVTVERIIEKKVQVPYQVQVPYPVEKIVEKIIDRPYAVTKYVDKPYPVEKRVPYPVEVEKIVEKQIPYPVEVKVPYKVAVPHAVLYPVEKIVEKPYPVHVNVPYAVEKIIDRPYAVAYPVHINVPYQTHQVYAATNGGHYNQHALSGWTNLYNINPQSLSNSYYTNGYQGVSVGQMKYPAIADSYYRRKPSSYGGNKGTAVTYLTSNNYGGIGGSLNKNYDSYIGPVPLKASPYDAWSVETNNGQNANIYYKYRRSDRGSKGLRIEYGGFKPPLIPSLEIDLEGNPVKRQTA